MKFEDKYPVLTLEIRLLDMPGTVSRKVAVRAGTSMRELHHIVQAVMDWQTSHLYEFMLLLDSGEETAALGDTELWEEEMPLQNDDRLYYLEDVFRETGTIVRYVYDMGDYWVHEIKLLGADTEAFKYPVLPVILEGEGQCPPEDCGGSHGYRNILEILSDKKHVEYKAIVTWLSGSGWKSGKYDLKKAQKRLNSYKATMWRQYMDR